MKYDEFSNIITRARLNRYLLACDNDTRKAMTLYRRNLKLTQELFTIISCFEVALRNTIDKVVIEYFGNNWLKNGAANGGVFDNRKCRVTQSIINSAIRALPQYSHNKLIAELGFGFWRYMFAQNQFNATNRKLLQVFPSKPRSNPNAQYNNTYIFNKLAKLNSIRNRMAHHEPICFEPQTAIKNTEYAKTHYYLIIELLNWMEINPKSFLYGIDNFISICNEIDSL